MDSLKFVNDTNALNGLWYDSHKNLLTSICVELKILDKETIGELTSKFLGDRPKTKKFTDPNKPKRSKSSWLLFCDDNRVKVKEDLGNTNMGQVTKKLGLMWKALTTEERQPYDDAAVKEKEKYLIKLENYNA